MYILLKDTYIKYTYHDVLESKFFFVVKAEKVTLSKTNQWNRYFYANSKQAFVTDISGTIEKIIYSRLETL